MRLLIAALALAVGVDPTGVWPLLPAPEVVRAFDPPAEPWGPGHRGVDLDGRVGQPVRSALPGRVVFVGRIAGRGVVVVSHGSTRTTYEPITARVEKGDVVSAGTTIGALDLAGSHCLPRACLHWGWIEGDTYLDPLRLVGLRPIRLLPLWQSAIIGLPKPRVTLADVLAGRPAAVGPW
ncbi:murein hydrolase activator EnvC family protein [Nocardioides caeni]|uniref:M23 family metallopeptidase n=1 Tax=Nocardioides caeni TaxID=574700 RepID=A0A4S8NL04_9ACTN|nr:M23 family metallopeptidase [Nocardioides caeni]THV17700.1 M23 family metallopeptidase [Nocardioides caeni]